MHPRTQKVVAASGRKLEHIVTIPPVAYPDMLLFEKRAKMIFTDSGGVQKEAYFLHVPCITLREETEWVETLVNGCNVLAGSQDPDAIRKAAQRTRGIGPWGNHYGDGTAGVKIVEQLLARSERDLVCVS